MGDEVETAKMLEYIAMIGDVLVEKAAGSDRNAIREVIRQDFSNPSFARGVMLGASSVLDCEGIPAFLCGEKARNLKTRILAIMSQFKILDALDARSAAAAEATNG